jgi:hypothetical protein
MQGPTLVLKEGCGQSVAQLERGVQGRTPRPRHRHMAALAGSRSLWLPFLSVILEECAGPAVMAELVRVV